MVSYRKKMLLLLLFWGEGGRVSWFLIKVFISCFNLWLIGIDKNVIDSVEGLSFLNFFWIIEIVWWVFLGLVIVFYFINFEICLSRGDVKKLEEWLILNECCINVMWLKNR